MRAAWFEAAFGFREEAYDATRRRFSMDGEGNLVFGAGEQERRLHVGRWMTPSLAELRERTAGARGGGGGGGGLTFTHLTNSDVNGMHHHAPTAAGGVFQVASQFNCLEVRSLPACLPPLRDERARR